ncbi:hypothetical protein FI667_g6748, partial [Globisporangium splendens]
MVGQMARALAASATAMLMMGMSTEATHTSPVSVDIGSHTHLADSTGLVNKNRVVHSNNVAITKSNVLRRQDDTLTLEADDGRQRTPAEEVIETGEKETLQPVGEEADGIDFAPGGYGYRYRFYYRHGSGYRYGWRYPIAYWNLYGPKYYDSSCGYGRAYGGYYYC